MNELNPNNEYLQNLSKVMEGEQPYFVMQGHPGVGAIQKSLRKNKMGDTFIASNVMPPMELFTEAVYSDFEFFQLTDKIYETYIKQSVAFWFDYRSSTFTPILSENKFCVIQDFKYVIKIPDYE